MAVSPPRPPAQLSSVEIASLAPEQIEQAVRERLDHEREQAEERRWEGIPDTTRNWLALAPPLPRAVANAVGLSTDVLDMLAQRGALQVQHPRYLEERGEEGVLYTVHGSVRERVLVRATADRDFAGRLRKQLARLGGAVLQSAASLPALTPPLERWSNLAARAESTADVVEFFDAEIEDAAKSEDAGRVLGWIESARSLAALLSRTLDPALEIALHRAGRRLELLHRHQQDRRHLRTFRRRDDQIDALRRLVDGPDDRWALHLFGSGGVGKTMLLRYLVAELAPRQFRPRELPTARIDFDYLNADYPRLAPGLLLWSFGQELRRYADAETIDRFNRGDGYLRDLHEQIRVEGSVTPSANATRDPRFIRAVGLYIAAMRSLPQPVILVLDTCEELAKIRPDGTVPENVRETFRILEALHDGPSVLLDGPAGRGDGLPSLRVVFAGRRPLAGAGIGWRAEHAVQPPRSYLALHELRGFTRDDAYGFLAETMQVPRDLIEPILDATRQPSAATPIVWTDPAQAPADVQRFNPYDLRLYADWANEKPPPGPDVVRHATAAQYVELRILQRLDFEPLERIVPALALVKHVDAGIVGAAGAFDEATTQLVFEQLAEQEWIELRRVSIRDGTELRDVLTLTEGLRRALASYFDERGGVPSDMARRVADHLERRTLDDDLGDLDWSTFDAALRTLELDGARAARWWPAVEARMVAGRGYRWLREVSGALVAEDNAAGRPGDPRAGRPARVSRLRAAVLASYAASLLRSDGSDQIGGVWPEVLEEAERVPEPALARRLRWRATAGLCAHHARKRTDPDRDLVLALIRSGTDAVMLGELDVELGAALIAAVDALLEHIEGGAEPGVAAAQEWLGGPDGATARGLAKLVQQVCHVADLKTALEEPRTAAVRIFGRALAGRLARLLGRPRDAQRHFKVALAMLRRGPALRDAHAAASTTGTLGSGAQGGTPGGRVPAQPMLRFADWIPPEDLGSRVRLEALRALPDAPPDLLLEMLGPAPDDSAAIAFAAPSGRRRQTAHVPADGVQAARAPGTSQDTVRLFSARLRTAMALGVPRDEDGVPAAALPLVMLASGGPLAYAAPQCNSQRWAPAAAITLAEAAAARGEVDAAMRGLRAVVSRSDQIDFHDLQHAERALLRIAFRYRLGASDAVSVSLAESKKPEDRELVWALLEFDESRPREPVWPPLPAPAGPATAGRAASERVRWLRAAWRTRMTLGRGAPDGYQELLALDATGDPATAALQLEIAEVTSHAVERSAPPVLREAIDVALDALWSDHADGSRASRAEAWAEELNLFAQSTRSLSDRFERRLPRIAKELGARRAAEIALFEADLLALRLPERARRLYDIAFRLYDIADDEIGRVLARQRRDILGPRDLVAPRASAGGAAAPGGDRTSEITRAGDATPVSVSESGPTYAGAPATDPSAESAVAAIAPLRDLDSHADWPELKSRSAPGWVPTLERAAVARAAHARASETLIGILSAEHPRFPNDELALPADLIAAVRQHTAAEGALLDQIVSPGQWPSAPPAAAPTAARPMRAAGATIGRALATVGTTLLGFAILGGMVAGSFLLFRWLVFSVPNIEGFGTGAQIGFYVLTLVVIATAGPWLVRLARSIIAARSRLRFTVRSAESSTALAPFVTGSAAAELAVARPSLMLRGWRLPRLGVVTGSRRFDVTVEPGQPYHEQADSLPKPAVEVLTPVTKRLRGRSAPLILVVDRATSVSCWEAILNYAARPDPGSDASIALRVRRRLLDRRSAARSATLPRRIDVVVSFATDIAEAVARRGWNRNAARGSVRFARASEVPQGRGTVLGSGLNDLVDSVSPEGDVHVLHLVGSVVETNAGLRFRQSDAPATEATQNAAFRGAPSMMSQSAMNMESPAAPSSELLSAADLERRYSGLAFCILQSEPVRQYTERLGSDRVQADLARAFAAELHAFGIPIVLVLPSLTPDVAADVLGRIDRLIAKPERVIERLDRCVLDVQRRILRAAGPKEPESGERAFDVCLYFDEGDAARRASER